MHNLKQLLKRLARLLGVAADTETPAFADMASKSEVKDSHDRYANIETNYLLQRLEAYNGLAILATNHDETPPHEFLCRFHFVTDFPSPRK
jgi:hypothetical protein